MAARAEHLSTTTATTTTSTMLPRYFPTPAKAECGLPATNPS